jgi:hypothetical protein
MSTTPMSDTLQKQRSYNAEQVETALHRMALEAGNSYRASEATGIPHQTLRQWRNDTHRERYEQIRATLEERLDRELAEDMAKLARQRVELLGDVGDSIHTNLNRTVDDVLDDDGKFDYERVERLDRDLSSLAATDRNLATSLGILTQNNRNLRDKPAEIVEHRHSVHDLDKAMTLLLNQAETVETTAIEDATVVPSEPVLLPATQRDTADSTHPREAEKSSD